MSSTPQGRVYIEISRTVTGGGSSVTTTKNPRLMTAEIRKLIERQNIDCADINCMKWPILGLSRYATFKCLMLQSDLRALIPGPYSPETDGFTVRFIVNNATDSASTASFNRMHLAHIQPLMISEYGDASYGEAFYLCTFHCDRWAARGYRISGETDH